MAIEIQSQIDKNRVDFIETFILSKILFPYAMSEDMYYVSRSIGD